MAEDNQIPYSHLAPGGRTIQLEHIQNCLPQKIQVILGEASGLSGQIGGDIALDTVKTVGNNVLSAHLRALFFGICLSGNCNTSDGDLLGHDGVNTAGKAQLDGSSHLTAVQCPFDKGSHHSTKGADVIKVFAHKVTNLEVQVAVIFLGFL